MILDFCAERDKRILRALEAHEPIRQMDKHLWQCNCGSLVFHVLPMGGIECVKCETIAFPWSYNNAT